MLDYFVFWATFSLFFQGNIRMLYTYLVPTYRILNSKFDISYKIDNFLQYHFFKDKKLITTNCLSTYLVLENPSYQWSLRYPICFTLILGLRSFSEK